MSKLEAEVLYAKTYDNLDEIMNEFLNKFEQSGINVESITTLYPKEDEIGVLVLYRERSST